VAPAPSKSLEAEADRAAAHLDDVDLDVVADADGLADAAGECEHVYPSMGVGWPSLAVPAGRACSVVVRRPGRKYPVIIDWVVIGAAAA
jgi:hypothetical protein